MSKDQFFVERRADGKYKVLRPNADRASTVTDTQRGAIDRTPGDQPRRHHPRRARQARRARSGQVAQALRSAIATVLHFRSGCER